MSWWRIKFTKSDNERSNPVVIGRVIVSDAGEAKLGQQLWRKRWNLVGGTGRISRYIWGAGASAALRTCAVWFYSVTDVLHDEDGIPHRGMARGGSSGINRNG